MTLPGVTRHRKSGARRPEADIKGFAGREGRGDSTLHSFMRYFLDIDGEDHLGCCSRPGNFLIYFDLVFTPGQVFGRQAASCLQCQKNF
jgi:hypothetical protein